MPSFSTAKVRDMFDDMVDISSQMIQKWERYVPTVLWVSRQFEVRDG